ncbi:rhodanese-like domain-containing protein [Polaribacter vadi]|uniref:rhodanese-like domain-containing protein n=1 Tax=Polaribacter TaxID=52959 RepID=UPI001C0949CC|nr:MULTISPECIES: rhodanese-like domain-containing protein [Polaribacter]MBU3011253.1 rhodanese-like domain-containing protein [Polaribacter vadi]MDO6741066.1 rhodanese-like domain-containing protein [Polaribacter sp. 1_MG-2023]
MRPIFCLIIVSLFFVNCNAQVAIKTITTKELKTLLEQDNILLMDVRSPKEIKEGFIQTAKFANYFDDNFYEIATKHLDKTQPVYLYCRSGNRSGKSAKILQEKGYEVYNVLGGYNQWKKEN